MKLLVIDGNSILNRAFYGVRLLSTKDGRFTNGIFGFMNIFLHLLDEYKPDGVAVAFDLKAPTFGHKMYDGHDSINCFLSLGFIDIMPVNITIAP